MSPSKQAPKCWLLEGTEGRPKWEYIHSEKAAILYRVKKHHEGLDTHARSFGRSQVIQGIQQHVDR